MLEWTAAIRGDSPRRPARAATGAGSTRSCAAAMCVIVRDLIVFGVLTDMMRGRPAVYATFSSYDEVAHHSGLERADTMEALRKLDQQFGRIERARRYAPRPYEIVVLSDHGQTQGATFKQRNGYGLDELVERSLAAGRRRRVRRRRRAERDGRPRVGEATGRDARRSAPRTTSPIASVVVLGSGNLGLIYLMEERRRLTLEEIDERHPELLPALREHPHVGWLLVRSTEHGAARPRRRRRATTCATGRSRARIRSRAFSPTAARAPAAHRRLRARRRHHGRQLLRPRARRGLRVRGADLLPRRARRPADAGRSSSTRSALELPDEPIVGAAAVHALLWAGGGAARARTPRTAAMTGPPRATVAPMIRGRLHRRARAPRGDGAADDEYIEIDPAELSGIFTVPAVAARRRPDVVAAGRHRAAGRRR